MDQKKFIILSQHTFHLFFSSVLNERVVVFFSVLSCFNLNAFKSQATGRTKQTTLLVFVTFNETK